MAMSRECNFEGGMRHGDDFCLFLHMRTRNVQLTAEHIIIIRIFYLSSIHLAISIHTSNVAALSVV